MGENQVRHIVARLHILRITQPLSEVRRVIGQHTARDQVTAAKVCQVRPNQTCSSGIICALQVNAHDTVATRTRPLCGKSTTKILEATTRINQNNVASL